MANYLWKITAKKAHGKLAAGAWVELVLGASRKPMSQEIISAFNAKYGDRTLVGVPPAGYLEMVKG